MADFWISVASRLQAGEHALLGFVVDHTPHSPGTRGARMAIFDDGSCLGTIGGGAMEQDLLVRAAGIVGARIERRVHRADHEQASGLICAGEQTNLLVRVGPEAAGVVLSCARGEGTLLVSPEGLSLVGEGEGDAAGAGSEPHRGPASAPVPWPVRIPLHNPRRIGILGGGHCALALSRAMAALGYHVTVVDDREGLSTMAANTFAQVRETVDDMREAAARVAHPRDTAVVCMGPDLESDVRSLTGALVRPFPFIGLMGAPAKLARIRVELRSQGFDDAAWARVAAPVGLAIGSRTPEEIAVSVAAQLIQRYRAS